MPKLFADSILSKNAQEAIYRINTSDRFDERQKEKATRIIKKLLSTKSRKHLSDDQAESRIDYISDHLGIVKEEVIEVINLLIEEKVLAFTKDLTAFIKRKENKNRSLSILKSTWQIEKFLLTVLQSDTGKIKLVQYRSSNLITPLVDDILSEELTGTTCVLTKTNEEALQITGLLVKNGMQAKLIQSNDGFNLYNLLEVRFFLSQLNLSEDIYVINEDIWENAKGQLSERFGSSINREICLKIIKDFEATNPKSKYKSDLEVFIRESKLEDFLGGNSETIFVSTIHKAKGREFDNVFLMLDQFKLISEEAIRQLYVAMTRAKRNLSIHYNSNYLQFIKTEGLERVNDSEDYLPPCQLALHLTYKDVWLDFFSSCQHLISQLNSGDELTIDRDCCRNSKGQAVLKFSKQLIKQIEDRKQKNNNVPKTAKIRFIVYWQKENAEKEIRIVLPELHFERNDDTCI
ncbi:3'-5' exonuclease [Desulfosporosinus sp. BICA1-9]|uniref:3'-5' exonuclease n=1 Tax=Desulfosporosinus sp. BICA1-9 TaxID=1531958 RepID=UPI000A750B20